MRSGESAGGGVSHRLSHRVSPTVSPSPSPSLRLSLSLPLSQVSNAPIQYWHGPTEDSATFEFEFGAGMGYSPMVYSALQLSASSLRPGQARTPHLTAPLCL
jgi:hypothetical protein